MNLPLMVSAGPLADPTSGFEPIPSHGGGGRAGAR